MFRSSSVIVRGSVVLALLACATAKGPVTSAAGIAAGGELGHPLSIRCLVYCHPQPSIACYHGPKSDIKDYEARANVLPIRSLDTDTLGEYVCQANNGVTQPASLPVEVVTTRAPPPDPTVEFPDVPIFTVPVRTEIRAEQTTLSAGAELNLPCEVDGHPEPDVYWTKDGVPLQSRDRIQATTQCIAPLGMQSGLIPDKDLSASSSFNDGTVGPQNGRLNQEKQNGAWCPRSPITTDTTEWLEIDLRTVHVVTGVGTQGRFGNGKGAEYAEAYVIEYWRPKLGKWVRYKGADEQEIMAGNTNTYLEKKNHLEPPIWASKIRVIPYSLHRRTVCMRVELYGCDCSVPVRTKIRAEQTTLSAGAELNLPCEVDGHPEPDVYWTKDGVPLQSGDRIQATSARLTVSSVTVNDSGVYGCHASNGHSQHSSTVQINVQVPVRTEIRAEQTMLSAGAELNMPCEVDGHPEPDVHWSKDGVPLQSGDRIQTTSARLIVSNVTMNDSGVYGCHASNGHSQHSSTVQINVQAQCITPLGMQSGLIPDKDLSASSSFNDETVGPQNGRLNQDKKNGAWCPRSPITTDITEWLEIDLRTVHVVTAVGTQGRFGNGKGAEYAEAYVIEYWRPKLGKWVRYRGADEHQIMAGNTNTYLEKKNHLEPPIWASKIRVIPYSLHRRTVCMRVELYGCDCSVPVRTKIRAEQTTLSAGVELNLPCEVDGHPEPDVYWTKDGVPLQSGDRIQATSARLTVSSVTVNDSGVYGCHASNGYSQHSSTVQINVQGYGCQNARFGCCPDNVTIARGYNNEGCGCEHTEHGCCPDKHTEASGPGYEGCSCHTSQFGCCPDGVTTAKGPHLQGCDCRQSTHGCCGDGQTAAIGPDQDGCDCASSKYGCCPDGQTEAKGEKFYGCTDVPENKQAACALPFVQGPCQNYSVYWFFDTQHGGCMTFWYGGCEGNGNRFATRAECEDACLRPSVPVRTEIRAEQTTLSAGAELNLPCEVDGHPEPDVHWSKDGVPLQSGDRIQTTSARLIVSNVTVNDSGVYGCHASNGHSQHSSTVQINVQGYGCQNARFGCCPDNVTIARGYNNEGCGCEHTEHGCCPDKHTEASGPGYEGCSCHTSQFGCCPDGVTTAKGPHLQGCDCRQSTHGCCGDGQTAAIGPDQDGCDCASSKYGCCPDGQTEAKGEKFYGCTDVPENKQAACALPFVQGPCQNYSVYWFFDTQHGGCMTFWYGGCEGNGNRFATRAECEDACLRPSVPVRTEIRAEQTTLSAGAELNLPCEVDGHPEPDVYWSKDGVPLQSADRIQATSALLIVSNVTMNDSGVYGCHASNGHSQHSSTVQINVQGYGCQNSRFGCCPDNVTTARGYNNEGCGCEHTEHGCCPDKHTEASGPGYEGCSCHTSQFGCCPDGVTTAKGPHLQGCDCRQSTHGCCGDGQTAAIGPDQDGCGCASSKYGCCPDGQTEAKGEKFYGCTDVPENKQAACALPFVQGPCQNYSVYWFFDTQHGGCMTFWYGGCEGNGNRFATRAECEDACLRPSEVCHLPKSIGGCGDAYQRWYYDSEFERCDQFQYTGCFGNANNFETREKCQKLCQPAKNEGTDI